MASVPCGIAPRNPMDNAVEPEAPIFIRVDVAARMTGLAPATIYEQVRRGLYEARRYRTCTLIRLDSLLAYLNTLPLIHPLPNDAATPLSVPPFKISQLPTGEPNFQIYVCERFRVLMQKMDAVERLLGRRRR